MASNTTADNVYNFLKDIQNTIQRITYLYYKRNDYNSSDIEFLIYFRTFIIYKINCEFIKKNYTHCVWISFYSAIKRTIEIKKEHIHVSETIANLIKNLNTLPDHMTHIIDTYLSIITPHYTFDSNITNVNEVCIYYTWLFKQYYMDWISNKENIIKYSIELEQISYLLTQKTDHIGYCAAEIILRNIDDVRDDIDINVMKQIIHIYLNGPTTINRGDKIFYTIRKKNILPSYHIFVDSNYF